MKQTTREHAQAKIVWGHNPEEVTQWLVANGVEQREAEATIEGFMVERRVRFRKRGIAEILLGLVLLVIGISFILMSESSSSGGRGGGGFWLLIPVGGTILLTNGIWNVVKAGAGGGSENPH